jgi:N-glycosylase/DNA lyase
LITFLCSANNHLKRIMPMARVLGEFGPRLEAPFVAHAFPTWDTLAALGEERLRERGFGYRAPRIPAVARAILARGGDAWLASLATHPLPEIRAALQSLPGVGPKLADCMALYALDRTDAVPIDTHLWQAATRHFFPEWDGLALTASRYAAVGQAFADRFGADAGWAQLFLYRENQVNRPRTRSRAS